MILHLHPMRVLAIRNTDNAVLEDSDRESPDSLSYKPRKKNANHA